MGVKLSLLHVFIDELRSRTSLAEIAGRTVVCVDHLGDVSFNEMA